MDKGGLSGELQPSRKGRQVASTVSAQDLVVTKTNVLNDDQNHLTRLRPTIFAAVDGAILVISLDHESDLCLCSW